MEHANGNLVDMFTRTLPPSNDVCRASCKPPIASALAYGCLSDMPYVDYELARKHFQDASMLARTLCISRQVKQTLDNALRITKASTLLAS
jgi:hypothetical protein